MKIDRQKFEPLYRAAKDMESAQVVGITYQRFGDLLQNFGREVLIARDIAVTEEEKKLVQLYTESLGTLTDCFTLWTSEIQQSPAFGLALRNFGGALDPIIHKYNLRRVKRLVGDLDSKRLVSGSSNPRGRTTRQGGSFFHREGGRKTCWKVKSRAQVLGIGDWIGPRTQQRFL
jgi:hypothetical protein